jgi:hypothetical protein
VSSPELRASDADRERVAARLREHMADGRLTLDELSERLGEAYEARTVGALDELTRDLPAEGTGAAAAPATSRPSPSARSARACHGRRRDRRPRGRRRRGERLRADGEKNERVADVPVPPGAPRIHVRTYVVMGSVPVRSKPRLGGPHGARHHGHMSGHEED